MPAYLRAVNASHSSVISVLCDDNELFGEIIRDASSVFRAYPGGSCRIVVLDSRGDILFDLWLPLICGKHQTLYVTDTDAYLI